jgi:SsrA-binding protein
MRCVGGSGGAGCSRGTRRRPCRLPAATASTRATAERPEPYSVISGFDPHTHRSHPVSRPKPTRPSPRPNAAKATEKPAERVVAENRRARHEYEILDTLECGIALVGSEVKSLRGGRMSLDEAYGRVEGDEVWLLGCDIPEYDKANQLNHRPKRPRKLLLHRREIRRFAGQAFDKGLTLVPLKLYFKNGRVKVLLGVGRGRKAHDKREKLKAASARRDMEIALRGRTRGGR